MNIYRREILINQLRLANNLLKSCTLRLKDSQDKLTRYYSDKNTNEFLYTEERDLINRITRYDVIYSYLEKKFNKILEKI